MKVPQLPRRWQQRLDAFPTQFVLTIAWIVIGIPLCIVWRQAILWVALMSAYANIATHWSAHQAWMAKRAAEEETRT